MRALDAVRAAQASSHAAIKKKAACRNSQMRSDTTTSDKDSSKTEGDPSVLSGLALDGLPQTSSIGVMTEGV